MARRPLSDPICSLVGVTASEFAHSLGSQRDVSEVIIEIPADLNGDHDNHKNTELLLDRADGFSVMAHRHSCVHEGPRPGERPHTRLERKYTERRSRPAVRQTSGRP